MICILRSIYSGIDATAIITLLRHPDEYLTVSQTKTKVSVHILIFTFSLKPLSLLACLLNDLVTVVLIVLRFLLPQCPISLSDSVILAYVFKAPGNNQNIQKLFPVFHKNGTK